MEHISKMAAEVNKLIGSKLLTGKPIHIPTIGSLYIVTKEQGAKQIEFSSSEQGAPLTEVIKQRASCTDEQATEIFNRWLGEVRNSDIITIGGVGELRGKTFVTTNSFTAQLNPTSTKTITTMATTENTKKSNGKFVWICIILFIVGVAGGYFAYTSISKSKAEKALIEQIAKEKALEQQRVADSIALAQVEAKRLAEEAAANANSKGPRYRVVYGVYDLRSNVDVAIKKINKQFGEGSAHEYPFGGKTLVSMFESDNRAECQSFLMNNYETYYDAWVYDSEQ